MTERRFRRVVVLGAGPGGLACAHKLCESGCEVTVLERERFVGGLARTAVREGFRFDLGGHRWFTRNRDLNGWFLRLMEGQLIEVRRRSRILCAGRWFDYPISIGNVVANAGLRTSLRCLADLAGNSLRAAVAPPTITTMEEAFVAQFGRRLYELFFRRYSEKVWGLPASQLSADWVSQRSKGLSAWRAIGDALVRRGRGDAPIETFVYPRLGYQEISETMRRAIVAAGQRVTLEADVQRVDVSDPSRVVVTYRRGGEEASVAADFVVSTIPLTTLLSRVLHPAPPADVVAAARELKFRSVITVNLMVAVPSITSDTWIYCHDEGLGFARLHEPRNWSPAMAPQGRSSVVLEYFCTKGDATWSKSEAELVEWGVADLCRLGFVARERVLGGFTARAAEAYPVYRLGYAQRLEPMRRHVGAIERLAIVGRGGTFRYNNADHSIEMGLVTAQMIAGEVDRAALIDGHDDLEYCERDLVESKLDRVRTGGA